MSVLDYLNVIGGESWIDLTVYNQRSEIARSKPIDFKATVRLLSKRTVKTNQNRSLAITGEVA